MTTIITLVVLVSLGIVLVDADGCIVRDNTPITILDLINLISVRLSTNLKCTMQRTFVMGQMVNQHLLKSTVTLLLLVEDGLLFRGDKMEVLS